MFDLSAGEAEGAIEAGNRIGGRGPRAAAGAEGARIITITITTTAPIHSPSTPTREKTHS